MSYTALRPWSPVVVVGTMVLVIIVAGCGGSLKKVAMPSPVLFADATNCLAAAAKILPAETAAEYCIEARRLEADRAMVAVEAAAEAEAYRCSWWSGCGYGGYGGYGNGYYSNMPIIYNNGGRYYRGGQNIVGVTGGSYSSFGAPIINSGGGQNYTYRSPAPPTHRRRP